MDMFMMASSPGCRFPNVLTNTDMREVIKFRGRREDGQGWVFGIPLKTHIGTYMVTEENPHICGQYNYMEIDEFFKVEPDTITQFTGLVDIFGKEIYDGDILDSKTNEYCPNGYQFICKWIDSGYALIYQGMTYSGKMTNSWMNKYPLCQNNVKDLGIIGNIFDNPELIKQD